MHLSSRAFSGLALSLLVCACRSPLADLPRPAGPFRLEVPSPALEDHSRNLRLLREPAPGGANPPGPRGGALVATRL